MGAARVLARRRRAWARVGATCVMAVDIGIGSLLLWGVAPDCFGARITLTWPRWHNEGPFLIPAGTKVSGRPGQTRRIRAEVCS